MRTLYYPESVSDWEYNLLQTGGSLPRFSGVPYQRGQGIGSFFRGLFRAIWPTLKTVGIAAGKEALKAGSEAARDHFNEGTDAKTALKKRGKQAAGRVLTKLGEHLQKGEGIGSRPSRKDIKRVNKRKKGKTSKRRNTDIFTDG